MNQRLVESANSSYTENTTHLGGILKMKNISFAVFLCYLITILSCFERNDLLEITNELIESALPRIASVSTVDNTHLKVTFTKEMNQTELANLANYSIPSLSVVNAVPSSDGLSVELTTTTQLTTPYTLTVTNINSVEGDALFGSGVINFTGDAIPEVTLVRALSKNEIEIQFSENIDPSSVELINFSLSPAVALTAILTSNNIVKINSAVMDNILYTLVISNAKDLAGNTMISQSIDFEGTSNSSYLLGSGTPYMDVATSGNLFYILLKDDSHNVYMKMSDMKGESFADIPGSTVINAPMTQLPVLQVTPDTAGNGENIYFSYFSSTDNTVNLYRSLDGGSTWTIKFTLNLTYVGSTGLVRPVIKVIPGATEASDRIYLAFYNDDYDSISPLPVITWRAMILAKSLDGGNTWQYNAVPSADPGPSGFVFKDIDVEVIPNSDSNLDRIYISSHDSNSKSLLFIKSFDGGASWNLQNVDPGNSSTISLGQYSKTIVRKGLLDNGSDDVVMIAYHDESTSGKSLKLARSTNGGNTFNKTVLDSVGVNTGLKIDMGFSGDRVYITYQKLNSGVDEIKLIRSKSFGQTWETSQILRSVEDRYGHLIVLGKYVHVFFESGSSITQMRSVDFGQIWPE